MSPDHVVFAADPVDPSEPLDEAHRIPVNVEIDHAVAVLEILSLRDAVRGDEHVDIRSVRHQRRPVF